MNKSHYKITLLAVAAVVGVNVLMTGNAAAAEPSGAITVTAQSDYGTYSDSIAKLIQQGVVSGYTDGTVKPQQEVIRAELAKMLVLGLQLQSKADSHVQLGDVNSAAWYYDYAQTAVGLEVMTIQEGNFNPAGHVTQAELTQMIAKSLQRDVLSVRSWMTGAYAADQAVSRGEAIQLIAAAQQAVRSEAVKITNIRSLNKVTMEVTFDRPLTLENESLDAGLKDFVFDHGLALVNQPRLKTGSFSTYVLPTTNQAAGTTYTLRYKGGQAVSVQANDELIRTHQARQVDKDSFELEILKSDGVTDYGYIISAYAGGRGSNAFILDGNNRANGQEYQIVSSFRSRSVTITPEGGEAMVASYLPFTQSTDGKQEPKFRLPNGAQFEPGVTYTVTSDWLTVKEATFVAAEAASVQLASVAQIDGSNLSVTLAEDPGDEIFVLREVKLIGSDGSEAAAQYTLQSRKGATGQFALQNGAKLTAGITYTVQPIGNWAVSPKAITLAAK